MKIAITGKGGVGKTTLAGMLARAFAAEGRRVWAIDADPDANLASSLGIPADRGAELRPLSRMKELAKERTAAADGYGSLFKLNPRVSDLPEKFCLEHAGVGLLLMGTVDQGGTGCVCPEHTLVKRLMQHLLLERDEVVIMDMEAGIEHLGRGTAESVDALIVVVEPGRRSLQTARQVTRLAADLGIANVFFVGSKVRDELDRRFLEDSLAGGCWLGAISSSDVLREADMQGVSAFDLGGSHVDEALAIKGKLVANFAKLQEAG
ncbi:ATP-binding protein [Desulfuromonas versatilis]|uniref:ATP-binding protein n=1 Tax=Desulfuromonas versatilis TaxID=2802975 RepID=UPI001C856B14